MTGQQGKIYYVAIYCRLSKDDGNASESSSINTQRDMLNRYVRQQGWNLVGEYIDDGYSGVTFDRPDFKRMIADIESGKINCVITKDLSRLGRNYLESGAYIEIFFPEHGVRYIALNDGVDTSVASNSSMDITPFKNLLNDMYASDISKKVKTAKMARLMQGKFMGTYAPYGYKKDPTDKNHLIIDEETAPIVRRIFDLAKQGLGISRIRNIMTDEHILRPGVSVWGKNGNYERFFAENEKLQFIWNNSSVRDILHDHVYMGHLVGCKRYFPSIKSKKRIYVPPEEWVIIKNTHEAIISQNEWELVQRLITSRRKGIPGSTGYDNIFVGIIKCADCGGSLRTAPKPHSKKTVPIDNIIYNCSRYGAFGKSVCSFHRIDARELHNVVLADIQRHAVMALQDDEKLLERVSGKIGQSEKIEAAATQKELRQAETRLTELDKIFAKLYEDRLEDKISEYNYLSLSKRYAEEQLHLNERINSIKSRLQKSMMVHDNAKMWVNLIKDFAEITELSAPLLNALIDRVTVNEAEILDGERRQNVNIYYKFIGYIG